MLCSDCKKNIAIIYINKIEDDKENGKKKNEMIGLCAECAKKRGIKPVPPMSNPLQNMTDEEMAKLSKQFENLFSNIDMDKLSGMFGLPNMDGMMDMDIDVMDSAMNELKQYAYSELVQKSMEQLEIAVTYLDEEKGLPIIEEIKEQMSKAE